MALSSAYRDSGSPVLEEGKQPDQGHFAHSLQTLDSVFFWLHVPQSWTVGPIWQGKPGDYSGLPGHLLAGFFVERRIIL